LKGRLLAAKDAGLAAYPDTDIDLPRSRRRAHSTFRQVML